MSVSGETISRVGDFVTDHRGMALGAVAAGLAMTLAQVEAVVINAHGDVSHRANGQGEKLKWVNDHLMWLLKTDAVSWATAHVGDVEIDGKVEGIMHHGMTDANIFPAYEVERYLRVVESDPEKYKGFPTLPKYGLIPNLDPSADFTAEEVRQVGSFGYKIMDAVLGDEHEPPESYTLEDAHRIMDFSEPRYFYDPVKEEPTGEDGYTLDQTAKLLLADAYSPVLEPTTDKLHNSARALDKHNVARFSARATFFKRNPHLRRPMFDGIENKAPENDKGPYALFGGAILAFTGYNVIKNGLNVDSVATGVAAGAAAAGLGVLGPIFGGKKVNGYGHDGRTSLREMWRMMRNKPAELMPDHDGSYMTKLSDDRGWRKFVARIADLGFAGELFGQPDHHKDGGNRAYTSERGMRAVLDNPATVAIRALANRSWLGLRPGRGFDLKPGERRPDEPNSILTDVIQPARVRTVYPEIYSQRYQEVA